MGNHQTHEAYPAAQRDQDAGGERRDDEPDPPERSASTPRVAAASSPRLRMFSVLEYDHQHRRADKHDDRRKPERLPSRRAQAAEHPEQRGPRLFAARRAEDEQIGHRREQVRHRHATEHQAGSRKSAGLARPARRRKSSPASAPTNAAADTDRAPSTDAPKSSTPTAPKAAPADVPSR